MAHALRYLLGPDATLRDALLALVDVAVVGFLVFRVLRVIRGTRAVAILLGLAVLGVVYLGAEWTGLFTLSWLLGKFLSASFIFGVIVLFQADLRRALAELGRGSRLLAALTHDDRAAQVGLVDAIVKSAVELARRRAGALVVLERSADLGDIADSGLRLDAALTSELLLAIFNTGSPLHDGAVVVERGRAAAACCLLPLSSEPAAQELGTRHRAALGLAEEVDAAVVVVSEERGEISVALDGTLHRGLDETALRALLHGLLVPPRRPGSGGLIDRLSQMRSAAASRRKEAPHAEL
ncbi:MAG TPA: diadenylate cyclase CdaA [Anaeromyxobacter sp.]